MRNRIKDHRKVRAGDLLPHEFNYRTHPESQVTALQALYAEVGFARSLLAFELTDGRLKLLDGHLRRQMHPEEIVDVEVLDLNDDEARKLLLSLDPLASLAGTDAAVHARLREITHSDAAALQALWQSTSAAEAATKAALEAAEPSAPVAPREQFLILIECANEAEQAELLERFQQDGLRCKALLS